MTRVIRRVLDHYWTSEQVFTFGQVLDASVVSSRSTGSQPLQEIALRIVKTAAPFPPLPLSIPEASKTVVVPLEFLIRS